MLLWNIFILFSRVALFSWGADLPPWRSRQQVSSRDKRKTR